MDFESKTPTHKKFVAPLDELIQNMEERSEGDNNFTLEEVRGFLNATALLVEFQDAKDSIRESFDVGVSALEAIAAENPGASEDIMTALTSITLGVICAANEIACQKIEQEAARLTNLSQFAAAKAKGEAVSIARRLWAGDADQDLRIGQAAKIILHELDRNGFGRYVEKTVRGWIKPVAPAYATKGGRPKKV